MCLRMRPTVACWVMKATIFICEPQKGHTRGSAVRAPRSELQPDQPPYFAFTSLGTPKYLRTATTKTLS